MKWKNGRKLNEELKNIQFWYFGTPDKPPVYTPEEQEELIQLSLTRNKLKLNKAR